MRLPSIVASIALQGCLAACSSAPTGNAQEQAHATALGLDSAAQTTPAAERPARMLRLVIRMTSSGPAIISATDAPNTLNRRDPHRRAATFFRACNAAGAVLIERGFELPEALTGEAHDAQGALSGARAPLDEPTFTIAVPRFTDLHAIELYRATDGSRSDAVLLGEVRP